MSYLDELFSLSGKTAIVTGASRGLGRAMSVALAKAGANLVLVGRDFTALHDTEEAIDAKKRTHIVQGSITSPEIIEKTITEARNTFGTVDILVNNAGVIRRAPAVDYALKDWEEVIETNLNGVFLWSQALCRIMKEQRSGKIINVASLLSFHGGINAVAYAASKGGVGQMTKAFANELAPHGVNVNAVAPGYFITDATAALRANPERSAQVFSRIPAGRWGEPSDLGGAVVFLASKASDYVNGHILAVDGGYLAY